MDPETKTEGELQYKIEVYEKVQWTSFHITEILSQETHSAYQEHCHVLTVLQITLYEMYEMYKMYKMYAIGMFLNTWIKIVIILFALVIYFNEPPSWCLHLCTSAFRSVSINTKPSVKKDIC